jgi:hypothetical protein
MRSPLLAAPAMLLAVSVASAAPVITFDAQSVAVSGITPKAQVAWFSVAREISGYAAAVVRRDLVAGDDDGDGVVFYKLDRDVPRQSVWVAVDLSNGAAAVAAPGDFPLRDVTPAHLGRGQGLAGQPEWTELDRPQVELLVVRPGAGAWVLTVGDGGQNDDSPAADGLLVASLSRLRNSLAGGPPAPDAFKAGDLVFAIDPNRLEYFAEKVAQ